MDRLNLAEEAKFTVNDEIFRTPQLSISVAHCRTNVTVPTCQDVECNAALAARRHRAVVVFHHLAQLCALQSINENRVNVLFCAEK